MIGTGSKYLCRVQNNLRTASGSMLPNNSREAVNCFHKYTLCICLHRQAECNVTPHQRIQHCWRGILSMWPHPSCRSSELFHHKHVLMKCNPSCHRQTHHCCSQDEFLSHPCKNPLLFYFRTATKSFYLLNIQLQSIKGRGDLYPLRNKCFLSRGFTLCDTSKRIVESGDVL